MDVAINEHATLKAASLHWVIVDANNNPNKNLAFDKKPTKK